MVLKGLKVDIPLKLTNVSFENELPFQKDSIWIGWSMLLFSIGGVYVDRRFFDYLSGSNF